MIQLSRNRGALLRWTAVLTGVMLAVTLGSTPAQAAITDPPTVVSLTFDDGNADQELAVPILDAAGMKGTFYITTGWIDAPTYFTRAQLASLKAGGHEIGGHSVSHPDLITLPADEVTKQICQGRNTLADWGFPTTSFAYPYASVDPAVEAAVQACGFNSARNLGDILTRFGGTDAAETIPPADAFQTRAPDQVDSTWTLADLQGVVTNAEAAGGGWVQLTFHHICATACDPLNLTITPELLQQFVSWLALRTPTSAGSSTNTVVKTVGDVVGGAVKPLVPSTNAFRPAPGPGVNGVLNPSLETPATLAAVPPLPPQCWQAGGFGVSTSTFSTVATAHTGTVAEQLSVTALTSGDAKLALTQDLGTCAPTATPGHTYSLRAWYTSTALTQFDVYYRNAVGGWIYWTSSPQFAATSTYAEAIWQTPAVPAGSTGISFGLNLISVGTLVTDDYALYDSVGAPAVPAAATRVAGIDRYLTAVQNSNPAYAPGVARVYVATGLNYPDALSAAPAAAHFASPLLLTTPDVVPAEVRAEIVRLNPGLIVIVGGPSVVSAAVAADLATLKPVVRLAGADRYATSRAIAQDAFGSITTPKTAYLATGENFPDALTAAPAAAVFSGPLILVQGTANAPDAATTALLASLQVNSVKIAGGTGVVSAGMETALRATPGVTTVLRNAGADRYGTAAAINQDAFASSDTVFLAVGTNFPDALVGAARAGWQKAALFLSPTACLDATAAAGIQRLGTTKVILLGGPSVLSDSVLSLTPCA